MKDDKEVRNKYSYSVLLNFIWGFVEGYAITYMRIKSNSKKLLLVKQAS